MYSSGHGFRRLIVDKVYSDLFEFAGEGIPVLIVPGNHERSILPASLFLEHPNIHVFDQPRTYSFEVDGSRLAFSGFPCRRKDVRAQFATLLQDSGWSQHDGACQLLCLHQTVEGARVGPSGYTFRRGEDVIPRVDLPGEAVAVLSGHIHREQVLRRQNGVDGKSAPQVVYPGSIERTSFAERDERKGFYDITLAQEAPGSGGSRNWISSNCQLDRWWISCWRHPSLHQEWLNSSRWKAGRWIPNSIVRLRCSGEIDPAVKRVVTSSLLRDLLPETMNYQFSSDFHQWNTG